LCRRGGAPGDRSGNV